MSPQRARRVAIGVPIPYRTLVVRHTVGEQHQPNQQQGGQMCQFGTPPHSRVAQIVCATPVPNLASLRDRVVTQAWMVQEALEVRHICRGFRRRLEAVAAAQGGYIDL